MHRKYLWHIGGAFLLAAAVAIGGLWLVTGRAHAQIDVSGEWELRIENVPVFNSDTCRAAFVQTDSDLTLTVACVSLGAGTFVGSIDSETGNFTVSGGIFGFQVELEGTAAADGSSISGTWRDLFQGFSGALSGSRVGEVPSLADVSGDWPILIFGDVNALCILSLQQNAGRVSGTVDCGDLGSGSLSGNVDLLSGEFLLLGGLRGIVGFFGDLSEDGQSIEGSAGPAARFVTLTPEEASNGVMAMTLGEFRPGNERLVQAIVAWPPDGGYTGFQIQLQFLSSIETLSPPANPLDNSLWPACESAERIDMEALIVFTCLASEPDVFRGAVAEFLMRVPSSCGRSPISFGPETHFLSVDGSEVRPVVFNAELPGCIAPPGVDGPGDIIAPVSGAGPSNGATPLLPFALLGLGVALATVGGLSLYQRRAR